MKPLGGVPLKTDHEGRVLVVIIGGLAWVVDKLGRFGLLPPRQLARHVDMATDPIFNVGIMRPGSDGFYFTGARPDDELGS